MSEAKLQWCELCQEAVVEVDPAKVRGFSNAIMVCPDCRKEFPSRQRVWWGKEQYKYYWDLGPTPIIPVNKLSSGPRAWYEIEVNKQQMLWLRAAGYTLILTKKEKENGD